jgi:hypothetical protein
VLSTYIFANILSPGFPAEVEKYVFKVDCPRSQQ